MDDIPVGFGMALAMNPKAMEQFSALPEAEQEKLIQNTHQIRSRDEMHNYVQNIAEHSAEG